MELVNINMLTVLIYRILFSKYFYAQFKTRTIFQTTSEENYTFSTEWNHITYTNILFTLLYRICHFPSFCTVFVNTSSENPWKISSQYTQYSTWNPAFSFKLLHLQTLSQQGPWCYRSNFKIRLITGKTQWLDKRNLGQKTSMAWKEGDWVM